VAAQSRSAIVAMAVVLSFLVRSLTQSWKSVAAFAGIAATVVILLIGAGQATATQVAERFAGTLDARDVSRVDIWRETLPMVADFPLTGVGAGAYGRAMLTYQQTRAFAAHLGHDWYFNHAHNHYLQLAAEGGFLISVPFILASFFFIAVARRRLRNDQSELRAVRLGAAAGLAGIATQSLWEVPLTMPAAALLAATLAALATYERDTSMPRGGTPL
jgi:O-antigen ligase